MPTFPLPINLAIFCGTELRFSSIETKIDDANFMPFSVRERNICSKLLLDFILNSYTRHGNGIKLTSTDFDSIQYTQINVDIHRL